MSENGSNLTEEPNVFRVPTENMGELSDKLSKLNKRAARLGTAPISLTVLSTEIVEEKVPGLTIGDDTFQEVLEWRTVAREWNIVRVDGETPMLNGWQFVATLVHGENGAVINRVPTFDVEIDLSQYRDADPSNCDHCKRDRRRIDTFVVYNAETGETKQVGRQCLKDFLGYNNPLAIAAQLERIREFMESMRDGNYELRGPHMESIVYYLAHVACMIRTNGWLSKSQCNDYDEQPTSAQAWWNLMDYGKTDKIGRKIYTELTDADHELAILADEWNHSNWDRDGNEFEANMAVAFSGDYFNERLKGFVAYGVQAYLKDRQDTIEREKKAENPSEWQGELKKRQIFENLTVSAVQPLTSGYGYGDEADTYLYTLIDDNGNYFKWFASKPSLIAGRTYNLKATVKKHDEWKGQKQTVITRAMVA